MNRRRLTMNDLYLMLRQTHSNLLDRSRWPRVSEMDSDYLEEVRRALVGARSALNGYAKTVDAELQRRGEMLAPVVPMRPAGDWDPDKHRLEGA